MLQACARSVMFTFKSQESEIPIQLKGPSLSNNPIAKDTRQTRSSGMNVAPELRYQRISHN